MSNHPNRGWRARMKNAAYQWLATKAVMPESVRKMLLDAYCAGYQDGRKSNSRGEQSRRGDPEDTG